MRNTTKILLSEGALSKSAISKEIETYIASDVSRYKKEAERVSGVVYKSAYKWYIDSKYGRLDLKFLARTAFARTDVGKSRVSDGKSINWNPDFYAEALEALGFNCVFLDDNSDEEINSERAWENYQRKSRSGQTQFRNKLMKKFKSRCAFTGSSFREILEAAHIVSVEGCGSDDLENGLLLRVDCHRLFDCGLISISEVGDVNVNDHIAGEYRSIIFPKIDLTPKMKENLRQRNNRNSNTG